MASAAAALVARARREIQHHFFSADAVRPDRAVSFDPANGFERRQFERMRSSGVIRQASPGLYWIDIVAYDLALRARHARVRVLLMALVFVLVVGLGLSLFSR